MTQPASVKVLTDLLARLKAATGPDRELDCYIEAYVSRFKPNGRFQIVGPPTYEPHRFFYCPDSEMDWIGYDLLIVAPAYTASLDAALALVERVLPGWCIENMGEMSPDCGAQAGFWLVQLRPRQPRRRLTGAITAENLRSTFDALDPVSHPSRPIALLCALVRALISQSRLDAERPSEGEDL